MGINVDYTPVHALGYGALSAGYGEYKQRKEAEAQRWNMMLAEQQARAAEQQAQRQAAAEEAEKQRRFQADRDQWQAKNQADRDMWAASNQADRDQFQWDKQTDLIKQKGEQEEYEYTEKQKRFIKQIDDDIAHVQTSDEYGQDEKIQIISDLKRRRMGLQPTKPKEPLPEPITDEYVQKNYRTLPNGTAIFVAPDGKTMTFDPKTDKPARQITATELQSLEAKAIEKLTVEKTVTGPDGKPSIEIQRPDQAQIDAEIERLLKREEAMRNRMMAQSAAPRSMDPGFDRGGVDPNLDRGFDKTPAGVANPDPGFSQKNLQEGTESTPPIPPPEIKQAMLQAFSPEGQKRMMAQAASISAAYKRAQAEGNEQAMQELRMEAYKMKMQLEEGLRLSQGAQ